MQYRSKEENINMELKHDIKSVESTRRLYIIKVFSIVSFAFTFPLGLSAYFHDENFLSVFLLGISILSVINYYLIIRGRIKYSLASHFILYPLLVLMLYLVASGGVHQTGPLWIFSLPATALFLYGIKRGLLILLGFSIAMSVVLFLPKDMFDFLVEYSFEFKIRLILVFLLVLALTLAYAYSTQKLFKEMHILNEKLSLMAEEDQLTGLQNRRGIQYQLDKLFQQSKIKNNNFSIILCDIDFFKDINDRYGHQIGDQVLTGIANIICESIRKTDMAARWGGEEFLIVLPEASQREAYQVAEKIRQNVLKFLLYHQGSEIKASLSLGVAQMSDAVSIDDLVRQADDYMYQAKAKGRNITMPFRLSTHFKTL